MSKKSYIDFGDNFAFGELFFLASCRRVGLSASWFVGELDCRRVCLSASWFVGELSIKRYKELEVIVKYLDIIK